MREFSLRNKSKNPIMTLSPAMLKLALAARPESVSLMLAKYVSDYKQLTGKKITIDYEQNLILAKHMGADERGTWVSRYSGIPFNLFMIERLFKDGFMMRIDSKSLTEDLKLAEDFFDMLDLQLAALKS